MNALGTKYKVQRSLKFYTNLAAVLCSTIDMLSLEDVGYS
jgi:hypothetical protein